MALVLKGLQAAGKIDGPALREAIAKSNVPLPSGTVKFDGDRNPQKAAVIMMYKGSATKYVTTIKP